MISRINKMRELVNGFMDFECLPGSGHSAVQAGMMARNVGDGEFNVNSPPRKHKSRRDSCRSGFDFVPRAFTFPGGGAPL
jgi:hypothetical protein